MEPKNEWSKKALEEFLQHLLQDNENIVWNWYEISTPLDALEELDAQVQGDFFPDIHDLIMNTYHKVEQQKKQK